jgi:membrane protein implicated in regulation of membrane protease activity
MTQADEAAAAAPEGEQSGAAPGTSSATSEPGADRQQSAHASDEPSVSTLASEWIEAFSARVRGQADLILAETKLALGTFMLMIFLTILAAGALLFAWAFLMVAIAQVSMTLGVSPLVTALVLLAVHGLLALILWRTANGLGRNMEFSGTRRLLNRTPDQDEAQ